MEKLQNLREMLTDILTERFSDGLEHVNTEEAGLVVDMIKDLAMAELYCKQACGNDMNPDNAMKTIRDIWADADPELKKRMKADLTALTT